MFVFHKRLKEARLFAEISQEKLGVLAGMDEETASTRMSQYERGVHIPDISVTKKIAKALNLPVAYFYSEGDDMALLVKKFHRLKACDKKRILEFIEKL